MPSPHLPRLLGLAAGTLALLCAVDASARSAAPKDDEAEPSKETTAKKKKAGDDEDAKPIAKKNDKKPAKDDEADEADDEDDKKPVAKKDDEGPVGPAHEKDGKSYYFVGARYRHTLLPNFLMSPFVAGGPTLVSVPAFGIEASKRRDGFEMIGALTYADYSMNPFPFKGKNEADTAYEIIDSKLKMINATADFLWSAKISGDELKFLYGMTVGLGFVYGDLHRNQAKPANGNAPGDAYSYVPCTGVGDPNSGGYCTNDNNHYNGYVEPSWAGGGYRPILYPTFGLQMGLRYKPVKEFAARLDVGFNLFSGFFFGVGADYGI